MTVAPAQVGSAHAADRSPGVIGHDDRAMLDATDWPWIAIGRVNRESGGFCTGTLVAADLVLTAAHCLVDPRTRRRVAPATMHFLAGYRRGQWLGHGVGRAYVLPTTHRADERAKGPASGHQGHGDNAPAPAQDWVLIMLDRPMPVRPVPVRALAEIDVAENAEQDGHVRLARAGYGRDRPHLLSRHDGCALLGRSADGERIVHNCDSVPGDSGSPLLVHTDARQGEGWFVVGIATGAGTVGERYLGHGVGASAFAAAIRARSGSSRNERGN